MNNLIKDLRYAFRMLFKTPGVTIVAVITLALGIGANTAIFSSVSAFTSRPLSVPHPEQLIRPVEITEERGIADDLSYPDFVDYRNQSTSFEGLSAEDMVQAAFDNQEQNDVIWGQLVSGNFFDVLQVKPIMGRAFGPDEDGAPGAHPVVVVGHSLWTRRLASDPNIVGKTVRLNNHQFQVIGVAPETFKGTKFGLSMDFWAPMAMVGELRGSVDVLTWRESHWMNAIGRLKPGVSIAQASAELDAISMRLNQTYQDNRTTNTHAKVVSEIDGRWGEAAKVIKTGGVLAMAIVGLVLLIACANVANLLLARAAARRKEIGIRLALGASRARLIRQLLTESLMLSLLGGTLGLVLAFWMTNLMQGFIPVLQYNIVEDFFALDRNALIFTLVVSVATGIIFGLAPAWNSSNPELVPVLKGGVEIVKGKTRRVTLRSSLVVAQVALSLVVLVCAGLFIKSFRQAQQMDPGFDAKNSLLMNLSPSLVGYDADHSRTFFQQIVERAKTIPGVESVALARLLPLGDSNNSNGPILKEGETLARGSAGRDISTNVVSSNYFKTMQIDLIDGRDFDERDKLDTQPVVIINQRMAQALWPGESAVGKRIFIGVDSRDPLEVVGVVKTGKYRNLAEDPRMFIYYALTQRKSPNVMTLIVRTNGDPRNFIGAVRHEVQALDRAIPISGVKTMAQHMTWPLWGPSMAATLSLAFGVIALLLSSVGLYSVMAYIVSHRTKEVGIRMALGASRHDVLKMITGQGMRLAIVGTLLGLVLALVLAKVMTSLLIGVSGYDVVTFAAVSALLTIVALIASYLPARRATKVDPLIALRYE